MAVTRSVRYTIGQIRGIPILSGTGFTTRSNVGFPKYPIMHDNSSSAIDQVGAAMGGRIDSRWQDV